MKFRQFLEKDDYSFDICGVYCQIKEMPMSYCECVLLEGAEADLLNFIKDRVQQYANQVVGIVKGSVALIPPEVVGDPKEVPPSPGETAAAVEPTERRSPLKKFRVSLQVIQEPG